MKRKNIIFLLIFVLLIVGIDFYLSVKTKNRTTKWRTATVEKGDIIISVTATGSIIQIQQYRLAPRFQEEYRNCSLISILL